MATDGRFLYFNPEFVSKLTNNQTITAVAHEVMHPASLHNERRGSRDHNRWNSACDYAINGMLKEYGFVPINIPGVFTWLQDEKYKGMTAEKIYTILPEDPPVSGCGVLDSRCSSHSTKQSSDEQGKSKTGLDPKQGQGKSTTEQGQGQQQVDWKKALVEAASFAKMRGSLPAGLEELVEKLVHPRVDWRRIIRNELVSCLRTDWSYSRPNRRYAHLGIAMPVHYGYSSEVECWLDSSGSISSKDFEVFLGSIIDITRQMKVRLSVGVCDSKIQMFESGVKDSDVLKRIKFVGRGGTSFVPPFEDAKKRRPHTLIYFTDLDGKFPQWRPSWRTIWAVPKGTCKKPPFGRVVEISSGGEE
jgi:predicted metal-dependent peptidase